MSAVSRVIPVTVVLYRVLMVCHVEFCYNHGEKVIRDKLFRWGTHVPDLAAELTCHVSSLCLMFPVAVATLTVIYRHHVRDYLICCSQEERLRFNLQDFWLEANYHNEDLSNLPRYHIFRALIAFICEI